MIVWGSTAGYLADRASQWMFPGIERNIAEGDMVMTARSDRIAVGYNQILDTAARFDCPVVLMHDDTELLHGAYLEIQKAWSEGVDIVGVLGASGIRSLEWWDGDVKRGMIRTSGGVVGHGWEGPGDVDAVDGLFLGLSARAARVLRFDEEYPGFHGYDVDICFQAKQEGLRVAARSVPLVHHTKGGFGDVVAWEACVERWLTKWIA